MSKTILSVNLNKIALLRNARGADFPNIVDYGRRALDAGAGGLTIHPRPDQRHARYEDIAALRKLVDQYPGAELNVEGKPVEALMNYVYDLAPHQFTFVPDGDEQVTSDHGYDLPRQAEQLHGALQKLKTAQIRSAVFVDPVPKMMAHVAELGADRVELYTEAYAGAAARNDSAQLSASTQAYAETAKAAKQAGLSVNAGHDLNLANLGGFLAAVPHIAEVSIGHALTVESLDQGWDTVVGRYVRLCKG